MTVEATMNVKLGSLIFLVGMLLAEPAASIEAPGGTKWLSLCVTTGRGAPVRIRSAKTGDQLVPLKSGDLIYQMVYEKGTKELPTLAFREGKLTEIVPGREELENKRLVNCAADEPKSAQYPIIALDRPSDAQLIYDEF